MRKFCTVVVHDRQTDTTDQEIAPRQGPLTPVLTPINVKAESGEAVPQSTQHGSDETLDSNSAESSIAGSGEDEFKAEQHSPEEEAEYFKFTDVFQRQSNILFGPAKNTVSTNASSSPVSVWANSPESRS